MGFVSFMKGVYRRMFPIKDIVQALGVNSVLSEDMKAHISLWNKCYFGKADWCDGDKVISLRIESSSVRELANVALNEMTTNVSNDTLNKALEKVKIRLDTFLQRGLAMGEMIIKPLGADTFQCLAQNEYLILERDADGNPTDIVFPEIKKVNKRIYIRLERHKITSMGLTITNAAYVSETENSLGREIPLGYVDEWKDYVPSVTFPVNRMIFGFYRNPNDNTVDGSNAGISVFETAIEKIKKADIQYGRLDYEFKSAERKIHADLTMVKPTKNGSYQLPEVYVDVNGDKEDFYHEFSPTLRQEGFIAGLEEYRRDIEFDIGLSYGDLSQPQYVDKTATEINASKYRKRNTVNHIQAQLKACLEGLVYAFAFYNRLTLSGYEFSCEFKDSFLNDETTEREEDRKDLANGTLRLEEYRARWRNEDIETAKANLPEQSEVY